MRLGACANTSDRAASAPRGTRQARRFIMTSAIILKSMRRFAMLLFTAALRAQTLQGVIDIHAHCDPDSTARSIDAIDLAKLGKQRGMRGMVLKNHYEPTASLAFLVRKIVPGIEAFGGIDLNRTVGGINPAAVEHMT